MILNIQIFVFFLQKNKLLFMITSKLDFAKLVTILSVICFNFAIDKKKT